MSNEEIIEQIRQGADRTEMSGLLYEQNKGLINKMVNKYAAYAEREDLMQESYFAMLAAVEKYESCTGAFTSYLCKVICRHLLRYIHNNSYIHISESEQCQIDEYKMRVRDFIAEYGKEPTRAQMALKMYTSEEKLKRIELYACMRDVCSIDTPCGEEGGCVLADMIPGETNIEDDVVNNMFMTAVYRELWQQVDNLPGQQSDILRLQYQEAKTEADIGKKLNVEMAAVRKEKRQAIKALRKSCKKGIIGQYADEYIYSWGLKNYNFATTWISSTEYVAMKRLEAAGM